MVVNSSSGTKQFIIHWSIFYLTVYTLTASFNKLQFGEITYVQVVFVMTGDCGDDKHIGYQVFEEIASTSSGQVYHINKTDVEEVCMSRCPPRTVVSNTWAYHWFYSSYRMLPGWASKNFLV